LKQLIRLPDGFDRDLKLLLCSMSLRRIAMGSLQVVRAIYFALLGYSPIEIGLLLSIATFVSAIHHITFGMLSDKFGRKLFFIFGGVFATMRMIIFAASSDFWMLAIGQGIGAMGEGAGAGQPVVYGYIADKTNIEKRSSIFSTLAVTNGLAATVGSLMAGLPTYFQRRLDINLVRAHSLLFWIDAASSAVALLFILLLRDTKPVKSKVALQERTSLKASSRGVIARFALVRSTSGLGWGFIESLLSLYFFIQFGVGGEVLGPIYAGARFLSVFSYMFIPRVVNLFGEISSLVASRLITAGLTVMFSLAKWYPLAVFLMVTLRVVIMFTMPIRQSFATGIVEKDETATAIGVSNFARMSLRTVAPTMAGYMFEAVSLSMPFLTGALLLAINGLLYRAFFQPKKESASDSNYGG
jgi:MFS family permease